jgi:hypothetical protein
MKTTTAVVLVLLALAGTASVVWAQRTNAQITGMVTDATGAVIPNAEITVTNEATGIKRFVSSNELGFYSVPLLTPGNYRMQVKKEGFRPVERTGILLQVDQAARLDFSLEVGTLSEAVEVAANASKVDTQTSTLREVVDERRIRELPLNGRDANQLIFLLPGGCKKDCVNGHRIEQTRRTDGHRLKTTGPTAGRL